MWENEEAVTLLWDTNEVLTIIINIMFQISFPLFSPLSIKEGRIKGE